jgi:uncharacterized DUF497 family protein
MEFSWDPKKAAKNLGDHKVSFEEEATIFGDALAITFNDPDHSVGEHRLLTFGVSSVSRLLVVSHIQRGIHIHLISARRATRHERKIYEEG